MSISPTAMLLCSGDELACIPLSVSLYDLKNGRGSMQLYYIPKVTMYASTSSSGEDSANSL